MTVLSPAYRVKMPVFFYSEQTLKRFKGIRTYISFKLISLYMKIFKFKKIFLNVEESKIPNINGLPGYRSNFIKKYLSLSNSFSDKNVKKLIRVYCKITNTPHFTSRIVDIKDWPKVTQKNFFTSQFGLGSTYSNILFS
jgi:hypothetical protein